jgi:signal peptidase I
MEPTITIGDRIVVDKTAFGVKLPLIGARITDGRPPERGEVVLLESPETQETLVKRIAAVPGDRVEVRAGRITIDGRAVPVLEVQGDLQEDHGGRSHRISLRSGGGPDFGPVVVPPDHYLVLGDNRGNSRDGRSFGLVSRSELMGRAVRFYRHQGEWTWSPIDR